jgi:hypothetical protein
MPSGGFFLPVLLCTDETRGLRWESGALPLSLVDGEAIQAGGARVVNAGTWFQWYSS